jgi:hypothetical protein
MCFARAAPWELRLLTFVKQNGRDAELPKQSSHIRSVQRISREIISCDPGNEEVRYDFLAFFFLDLFAALAGVAVAGAAMGFMFFTFHS